MLYGEEKKRAIARSILPAQRRAARTASKDKRRWNRSVRRRMNMDLTPIKVGAPAEAAIEAYEDQVPVWHDSYSPRDRGDMNEIRDERRLADNLSALRSWTRYLSTVYTDPNDLMEFLDRELPRGLAGRHALQHMELEFGPDRFGRYHSDPAAQEARAEYNRLLAEAFEAKVLKVFEWRHKRLNTLIKANNHNMAHCQRIVRVKWLPRPANHVGYWYGRFTLKCAGVVTLTQKNMYADFVPCPECGDKIKLHNIKPVGTLDEAKEFASKIRFDAHNYGGLRKKVMALYDEIEGVFFDGSKELPHVLAA